MLIRLSILFGTDMWRLQLLVQCKLIDVQSHLKKRICHYVYVICAQTHIHNV